MPAVATSRAAPRTVELKGEAGVGDVLFRVCELLVHKRRLEFTLGLFECRAGLTIQSVNLEDARIFHDGSEKGRRAVAGD